MDTWHQIVDLVVLLTDFVILPPPFISSRIGLWIVVTGSALLLLAIAFQALEEGLDAFLGSAVFMTLIVILNVFVPVIPYVLLVPLRVVDGFCLALLLRILPCSVVISSVVITFCAVIVYAYTASPSVMLVCSVAWALASTWLAVRYIASARWLEVEGLPLIVALIGAAVMLFGTQAWGFRYTNDDSDLASIRSQILSNARYYAGAGFVVGLLMGATFHLWPTDRQKIEARAAKIAHMQGWQMSDRLRSQRRRFMLVCSTGVPIVVGGCIGYAYWFQLCRDRDLVLLSALNRTLGPERARSFSPFFTELAMICVLVATSGGAIVGIINAVRSTKRLREERTACAENG